MKFKIFKIYGLSILIVLLLTFCFLSVFASTDENKENTSHNTTKHHSHSLAEEHLNFSPPETQNFYGRSKDIFNISAAKAPTILPFWPKRTIKVFPGAEGFGTETPAGRGGKIIKVTNLRDSGRGSLRTAINTKGAKIIVFEVAGVIELKSNITISHSYCTIAGQTAPPPGITIKNFGIRISAHDILIQHLRIRPGDEGKVRDGQWDNLDAIQLNTGAENVVIDHVSASWAIDENISTWTDGMNNATFSNCMISEGLHNSVHSEQPHSKGLLIGPNSGNISIIGNLMAHNFDRVPQLQGGSNVLAVNNLIYEGGAFDFVDVTDPYKGGQLNASFEGNIFIDGPATTAKSVFALARNLHPESKFFQRKNLHIHRTGRQTPALARDTTNAGIQVSTPPVSLQDITVRSVATLEDHVLRNAGARPGERGTRFGDPVDERIVNQVKTRTGKQIDCVEGCTNAAPGGWPETEKSRRPFPIPLHPNGDFDGDGYSNIEELLHRMAASVENRSINPAW